MKIQPGTKIRTFDGYTFEALENGGLSDGDMSYDSIEQLEDGTDCVILVDSTNLQSYVDGILPSIVRFLDSELPTWSYKDPETEREFQIRLIEGQQNLYHLSEFIPNGRMFERGPNNEPINFYDEDLIGELERLYSPNSLLRMCRKEGDLDPGCMIFAGAGLAVNSIYHPSLEACAEEIVKAIASNKRYSPSRKLSDEEKVSLQRAEEALSAKFWQQEQEMARKAFDGSSGVFKGCYNLHGEPIGEDRQKEILGFLNKPSLESWLDIRSTIISGSASLWSAWCQYDEKAPRSGSDAFPDPETLRLAIRDLVERRLEVIDEKVKTRKSGLRPV